MQEITPVLWNLYYRCYNQMCVIEDIVKAAKESFQVNL